MLIQTLDYLVNEVVEIDDADIQAIEKIDNEFSIIWNSDSLAYQVTNKFLSDIGILETESESDNFYKQFIDRNGNVILPF